MVVLANAQGPRSRRGLADCRAAMAGCLYDPAFATLSLHSGPRYRSAVTALTLFGGFREHGVLAAFRTCCWSLGLARARSRSTPACTSSCALPIHRCSVPRQPVRPARGAARAGGDESPAFGDPRLRWLTLSLRLATFVFGVIAGAPDQPAHHRRPHRPRRP
jgi:hypothetical protein